MTSTLRSLRVRGISVALLASLFAGAGLHAGDTPFIRGMGNEDTNPMSTAIAILHYLFWGAPTFDCIDAADANDDGAVNLTDAVYVLNHAYAGGPPLPAPSPRCGVDPTPDELGCERQRYCSRAYYGVPFEADAVVFVLDRSQFMLDNGEAEIARREVWRLVLSALPAQTEYGVVYCGEGARAFPGPDSLAVAGEAGGDLVNWMGSSAADDPRSCPGTGLLAALNLLTHARGKVKAIFYAGTGRGVCDTGDEAGYLEQALADVTAGNGGSAVINAIQLVQFTAESEKFLRALAEQNGGVFTQIAR